MISYNINGFKLMKYIFLNVILIFNLVSCSERGYKHHSLAHAIGATISFLRLEVETSKIEDEDKIEILHSRLSKVSEKYETPIFIQCVSDSIQDLEDVCVFIFDVDEGLIQIWPYESRTL